MLNEEELKLGDKRFNYYKEFDPFQDIPPALLNSADIHDYIHSIGMVSPFDQQFLKGTTLTLRIGGDCVYWNDKREKIKKHIKAKEEFTLKSNTIAYVSIFEKIRLPRYIIARFNLRVTNAYRGILLGTGPIVDPGFTGWLNIPLHNLTNNDYVFYGGEELIEMEFTKLSPNQVWTKPPKTIIPVEYRAERIGKYEPWDLGEKANSSERDLDFYLRKANLGHSIESSLPSLQVETNEAIESARATTKRVDDALGRFNVGLLFSFGALLTAMIAIVNIFRGDVKEIRDQQLQERIISLQHQHVQDSILLEKIKDSLNIQD